MPAPHRHPGETTDEYLKRINASGELDDHVYGILHPQRVPDWKVGEVCDYCEKPAFPLKETSCIGPIWTKHGGQPWACEECYEHIRQRENRWENFKFKLGLFFVGMVMLIIIIKWVL